MALCLLATPLVGAVVVEVALNGANPGGLGPVTTARGASGTDGIPASMLAIYRGAARVCPGLSWTTLAAIGTIESDNGLSSLPGVHSGHNAAGAEGPLQFEPSTFGEYDLPLPVGGASPPSPYDPIDAAYAAARMLCANGADGGRDLPAAILAYNHSTAYVDAVLVVANRLDQEVDTAGAGRQPAGMSPAAPVAVEHPAASVAVEYAVAQIGTPYRWGGETPGVGFDCSGLAQAAWAAAGVHLPRVAQDQFDAGPLLPPGAALQPGDLVFFGPASGGVTHVGMVVDPAGQMVDAPHTGAVVRLEPFPATVGARWGGDVYLGATRPDGV
jgi:cell wall-associated NlpC family hydrolase